MHGFVLILLFLVVTAFPAGAEKHLQQKTVIEDQEEAERLLGKHLFADGNLARYAQIWEYRLFGDAIIKNHNGVYTLKATQSCYQRIPRYPEDPQGGATKIEGHISKITSREFLLSGEIDIDYLPYTTLSGGNPFKCNVKDNFVFSRKGHKQHWRLQNPQGCLKEALTLVDIYVEPLKGEAPHEGCVKKLEDLHTLPWP